MITFFSNFINEHQIPFCEAMYAKTNGDFRFVATQPMDKERIDMGFKDKSNLYPYVVKSFESTESYETAMNLGVNSDVVIIGSAPDEFIIERLKLNKMTFRYYERFFKEGKIHILDPRVLILHYKQDFRYRNKNLYMLCASAYTAPDCKFILSYPNKTYKWGYFPEITFLPYKKLLELKHNNKKVKILWAGRMINWKHPEAAVYLARRLKDDHVNFSVDMIGAGFMQIKLETMIKKYALQDDVKLLGSMPPETVRKHMQTADIFLFTSDRNEGWGAVLNESMSSACAVVANKEIGSVPYLIENEKNGLIYDRKNKGSLYKCVRRLIDDAVLRQRLGKNAYETIKNTWNADAASDRLLTLIDCINNGTPVPFTSGPCSKD